MPIINVTLNELDNQRLEQEHKALVEGWHQLGNQNQPPTFASWLGTRLARPHDDAMDNLSLSDIRVFNAIENLISSCPQHGFNLAHIAISSKPADSSQALASALVETFKLQPHYAKRLQELFSHYAKTAKEVADVAQVGVTNHAYGALTEVYRKLIERTSGGITKLGADKAIGRVEGATAILVGLGVMDRTDAKKRTNEFKKEADLAKKSGWVGKIFGEN
jgi:hypothetical protein